MRTRHGVASPDPWRALHATSRVTWRQPCPSIGRSSPASSSSDSTRCSRSGSTRSAARPVRSTWIRRPTPAQAGGRAAPSRAGRQSGCVWILARRAQDLDRHVRRAGSRVAVFRWSTPQAITTAAAADPARLARTGIPAAPGTDPGAVPVRVLRHLLGGCAGRSRQAPSRRSASAGALREFGYIDTDAPHPLIRLAARRAPRAPSSIVIPPWTGVLRRGARRRRV